MDIERLRQLRVPEIKRKVPAQLVVADSVYHQQQNHQPTSFGAPYIRLLESDEQPYGPRRLMVTEQWVRLEYGWLNDSGVSYVLISNLEGQWTQVQPSHEERSSAKTRILEIAFTHGLEEEPIADLLVLPGETERIHPANHRSLWIRCRQGTAQYTLMAFPQ